MRTKIMLYHLIHLRRYVSIDKIQKQCKRITKNKLCDMEEGVMVSGPSIVTSRYAKNTVSRIKSHKD